MKYIYPLVANKLSITIDTLNICDAPHVKHFHVIPSHVIHSHVILSHVTHSHVIPSHVTHYHVIHIINTRMHYIRLYNLSCVHSTQYSINMACNSLILIHVSYTPYISISIPPSRHTATSSNEQCLQAPRHFFTVSPPILLLPSVSARLSYFRSTRLITRYHVIRLSVGPPPPPPP